MRIVDEAVLARLATTGVDVNDGFVDIERSGDAPRVVTQPLPFVIYYANIGSDHTPRLHGRMTRRSVFFQITYVGIDRRQAKAAGERQRDALAGFRLTLPGHRTWPIESGPSQRVRRDDDVIRPDGAPLFYGVDEYSVSLTNRIVGAIA